MDIKDTQIEIEKTEDELSDEVSQEFGWNFDDDAEKIDKVVKLRQERYAATKQKNKAYKLAGLDPKTGEPVKKSKPKRQGEKPVELLVSEQVFLQNGGSKTDLRHLREIMAGTGKTFSEAKKSFQFKAYLEKKEAEFKSELGQLGASHRNFSPFSKENINSKKLDKDEVSFLENMGVDLKNKKRKK